MIAIVFPLYAGLLAWLGTFLMFGLFFTQEGDWDEMWIMFRPGDWELDELFWWWLCGVVLCAAQLVFLLPVVARKPLEFGRAKSLKVSMVIAGFVAMALTLGLALAVAGLMQLIVASRLGLKHVEQPDFPGEWWFGTGFLALIVVSWLVWSILLIRFARRRQGFGIFGRVVGLLLGGTIAEVLVVLPLDIMVRRRTDCYCATGSFWTLCLAGWSLLWLAGPGIVIAVMSKRRRWWFDTHCRMCGYEKGPAPAERCPECGYEWKVLDGERAAPLKRPAPGGGAP